MQPINSSRIDGKSDAHQKQKIQRTSEYLQIHTDGSRILHILLVKHYNDLLYGQSSERGKDEVTYIYVGDIFCIHLGTKYADFQEKIFVEISGKKFYVHTVPLICP